MNKLYSWLLLWVCIIFYSIEQKSVILQGRVFYLLSKDFIFFFIFLSFLYFIQNDQTPADNLDGGAHQMIGFSSFCLYVYKKNKKLLRSIRRYIHKGIQIYIYIYENVCTTKDTAKLYSGITHLLIRDNYEWAKRMKYLLTVTYRLPRRHLYTALKH